MNILNILTELAGTASTKEKEAIIRREKNNELLKLVFQAAYNTFITYNIKQIPEYTRNGDVKGIAWAITGLQDLVSRKVTGNDARDFLKHILSSMYEYDAEVVSRIIDRDLRCGCTDTIASKVWPGLVPTFDVMLSHKDISGIKFPAYAQIKSDGARCHMSLQAGKAVAFSRSGKPIELHGTFDTRLRSWVEEGGTLDGELLAMKDGKILDRKTGNGIVNKAVKGTISKEEAEMLVFATWDKVDFTSTIPYRIRLGELQRVAEGLDVSNRKIFLLATEIVTNKEEAQVFFEKCLEAGEEGAMIKNMDAFWVPKRTKDLGKMKAEEVADLVVVDYEEGTGKYAGMLGSLVCETSDGKLRVNVGTGFSDQDREDFWKNRAALKGQIVEVMYNQIITSRDRDTASLFLPRFMSFRFDKAVANKLEELK